MHTANTFSDFDCNPSKGQAAGLKFTTTWLTDLMKKDPKGDDSIENRNFPMMATTDGTKRYEWIKAYGCMLYVDNPSSDGDSKDKSSQGGIVQGDTAQGGTMLRVTNGTIDTTDEAVISAADLYAAQAVSEHRMKKNTTEPTLTQEQ